MWLEPHTFGLVTNQAFGTINLKGISNIYYQRVKYHLLELLMMLEFGICDHMTISVGCLSEYMVSFALFRIRVPLLDIR